MIVLDTNVLSAIIAAQPVQTVVDWLDRQPPSDLYLNAVTLFEIRTGIESLVPSRRREDLDHTLEEVLADIFDGRMLPFDRDAAVEAAKLAGRRGHSGRPRDSHDTQIAGIALSRGAAIATRNVRHFNDLNISVVNPWDAN